MRHLKIFIVGLLITIIGCSLVMGLYATIYYLVYFINSYFNGISVSVAILRVLAGIFIVILIYYMGYITMKEYGKNIPFMLKKKRSE